jgi:DUF438 domain-containing protein
MNENEIMKCILDSWNKPVVFVDTDHVIVYMNEPARKNYAKWGDVIGKSIFHCHNEQSCRTIREVFMELEKGAEEVMITNSEKHRVYMRSVRDKNGKLLGYFERYEPPSGK